MFEAEETAKLAAPGSAVWALWADPSRWPEWNPQMRGAQSEGELAVGSEVRVRMRKGGTVRHVVIELAPRSALVTEVRLPGARVRHEHRVADMHQGSQVTHRVSVSGPLWALWAPLLGRRRMRESLAAYADSERRALAR